MERTPGVLYRESLGRVVDIVSSLDDDALAQTVAATPKWSARDVLAHLAGACEDFCTGNLDGAGGEAWTAAQVARAQGRSVGVEQTLAGSDAGVGLGRYPADALGHVTVFGLRDDDQPVPRVTPSTARRPA